MDRGGGGASHGRFAHFSASSLFAIPSLYFAAGDGGGALGGFSQHNCLSGAWQGLVYFSKDAVQEFDLTLSASPEELQGDSTTEARKSNEKGTPMGPSCLRPRD